MAKKTRQELLKDFQEKVDKSREWRRSEQIDQTWRRLNDLYRGKHWPGTTLNNQDLIAVNLAFSTAITTLSISSSIIYSSLGWGPLKRISLIRSTPMS